MDQEIIAECLKLGCKSEKEAVLVLQVYLELCEVKRYWDVEYFYEKSTENVYVRGRKTKNGPLCLFIPIYSSKCLSLAEIHQFASLTSTLDIKSIYLVFVATDSSCVYYEISNGLSSPPSNESKRFQIDKQELIDSTLNKYRKSLEQAAMLGVNINLLELAKSQNTSKEET